MTANQLRIPLLAGQGRLRVGAGPPTLAAILLGATGAAYIGVQVPGFYRAGLAIAIGLNLIVLSMKWPRSAAIATLMYLPFLGLIRRLLIDSAGWTANDPLVLVGPVVVLFLFYRLYVLEGRRMAVDLTSKLVLGLIALGIVQVLNPLAGGGLVANIGGLIFLAVPLLWFFVGRAVADDEAIEFLMKAVIVVAVIVGLYGMWQTEWRQGQHLPPWDQSWFDVAGYSALKVFSSAGANNTVRAFSTFPSNGEYTTYLSFALIFIFSLALHKRYIWLLASPLLAAAIFYAGGRSGIALTLVAVVIMLGARTRNLALGLIVFVVGVGAVFGFATVAGPRLDEAAGVSDNAVTQRNVGGLLHPLDPSRSSVLGRWDSFTKGIGRGFQNPAGSGTGASNRAGAHLSDDSKGSQETDNDVADVFLSLGLPGGLVYLVLIFFTFREVFRRYTATGSWMAFGVAGVLIVMFGNWLNGGMYALSALTWFLIGWATRPQELPEAAAEPDSGELARA